MPSLRSLFSRAAPPRAEPVKVPTQLPCSVCDNTAVLYDVVDFNKSCEEANGKKLPDSGQGIRYYRCADCGFCFAPQIAAWSLAEFEERIYNQEYVTVDPDYLDKRPKENAESLIEWFGDIAHGIRHLDYGGGNGKLSALLNAAGWNSQTYDPFVNGSADVAQLGQFDFITAFEVFEHVPAPRALLATLSGLLKPEAIVVFSTLMSDGEILPGKRLTWWYAAPRNGHISLFSKRSMEVLAGQYQFNLNSFSPQFHSLFKKVPAWAERLERP